MTKWALGVDKPLSYEEQKKPLKMSSLSTTPNKLEAILGIDGDVALKISMDLNDLKPCHEKEQQRIDELIREFGKTVDKIEDHEFAPPSPTKLTEKMGSKMSRGTFATRVCGNCDARFSCMSYRTYAAKRSGQNLYHFKKFYIDPAPDAEQEEWMDANFDLQKLEQALNVAID